MASINKAPRHKRCARAQRLLLGAVWLKKYHGKNLIKGYAKHFGVNKPCAIKELEMLGVELTEQRKKQVIDSYNNTVKSRRRKKEAREEGGINDTDSDEHFAFIAGYTAGGAAYGITWKEWKELEKHEPQ
jgi:hypothetical protein